MAPALVVVFAKQVSARSCDCSGRLDGCNKDPKQIGRNRFLIPALRLQDVGELETARCKLGLLQPWQRREKIGIMIVDSLRSEQYAPLVLHRFHSLVERS
ncbi:hypothetical protein Y1Q_0011808 [Alligator mississippiensis]|uniref:Uncharacterized protein n=1 Tax=Alligator mississippiensis TaxID=8496 RepID=A0A151M178_ALLMI|nr:hypothetical protein Y1Q_0011808 [Alligator mississippiensis]